MYLYTIKLNGKKYSTASWVGGPGTCLRLAECVFLIHGQTGGRVEWQDSVEKEKGYAGRLLSGPPYLFLTDTPRLAARYFHNEHIRSYVGMRGASAARTYLTELWQDDQEAMEDLQLFFKNS
jgi:hypothetical protein